MKVMKKFFVAVLVIALFVPYISGIISVSVAVENDWRDNWKTIYDYENNQENTKPTQPRPQLSEGTKVVNWHDKIRSFQYFAYEMNKNVGAKWLFYDIRDGSKFQNLNCIRSGSSQDDTYIIHDLYTLKEENQAIFNELFEGPNNVSADRNYQHLLWEIENYYLFDENDTPEQKKAKFDKYNQFIGATDVPFAKDLMAKIQLYILNGAGTLASEKVKNLTENEVLVKSLQNEMLLPFVQQTSERTSNVPPIKKVRTNDDGLPILSEKGYIIYDDLSKEANDYVEKIVSKFGNINNSASYDLENINKYFYSNPEIAKVKLTKDDTLVDVDTRRTGSFYVKNKFKADITDVNVYLNGSKIDTNTYKILNSSAEDVTNSIKDLLKNSASQSEYEFKIEFIDGVLQTGTNIVEVEINVDYGYITQAILFEPINKDLDAKNKGCQYVIDLEKNYETDVLKVGSEIEIPKYFDLALTKQIVNTSSFEDDASEIDDFEIDMLNRLNEIDMYSFNNETTQTARYVMNKKPVLVEPGEIITYKITIYNEGQLDGYAEEITDYLPEEVSLVESEYDADNKPLNINAKYGWKADSQNAQIVRTNYLSGEDKNPENLLSAYAGKSFNNNNIKTVYLQCKVNEIDDEKTGINKIVDNRAEITKYGYYKDNQFIEANAQDIDRDSIQNSVITDLNENSVKTMLDKIENEINNLTGWNEINDDKAKTAYEDDDDIERIKIVKDARVFDLALRKWIVKIDDTEYDREPLQVAIFDGEEKEDKFGVTQFLLSYANELLRKDTLEYDNPKNAIKVYPGSIIKYEIGIFNEGTIDGYAEEITDYLPEYLEFIDNEENAKYGWTATKNSDGTTTVKTRYLSEKNGTQTKDGINSNLLRYPLQVYADRITFLDNIVEAHRTIPIICRVSENAKNDMYLTNRAEITEYGYYNKQNEFVKANAQDIDRDSQQDTIKNSLNLDTWYASKYLSVYNNQTPQISFPGEQDDDDFETVLVEVENDEYSVEIKKVSKENNNKIISGAIFNVSKDGTSKESNPTGNDGLTKIVENTVVSKVGEDKYIITEKFVPEPYKKYDGEIQLIVAKKLINGKYTIDEKNTKVIGENVELNIKDNVITITVSNPQKEFDLSLRKFITAVNQSKFDGEQSREPKVDLSTLINGDSKKNGEKTATYTHTKDPVLVNPTDIVEYTLRIYNEGELDGYASRIIDDVPAGVVMVAPEYDEDGNPTNLNAKYRWVMYKEMTDEEKLSNNLGDKNLFRYNDKFYIETENEEEAVLISSDYLSMENGIKLITDKNTKENPNLIKAFDGKELCYKDINVEFKVVQSKTKDTIITNYAQISDHQGPDGISVTDRDSTPNVWEDGEDDQDIENLKVNWFDLALYKWVSSTIVTEDGKTKEFNSEHTQYDKEKLVNVTVAKEKLDKTVVKFKWTIKVENQSPIPGYATELKDHIPAGLKFVEEDNKEFGWKLQEDGTVTTDYLKNTLLAQNETAEVTLILTWINGENNLGAKVNNAEISEDFNAYDTPDIDSTPNNFTDKPLEDDEDLDEVRLNIKTGGGLAVEYISLGFVVLAILITGTVLVKKNVLDK